MLWKTGRKMDEREAQDFRVAGKGYKDDLKKIEGWIQGKKGWIDSNNDKRKVKLHR